MPNSPLLYSVFRSSLLDKYVENDPDLFPGRRVRSHPGTIVTVDGEVEWFVDRILDERKRGRGCQYLVRWVGEGAGDDLRLLSRELKPSEKRVEPDRV
ncbi:hypothetical protein FIBSPDRAFT_781950 [Athelia psychrophila]|uniref:Chromo domain-containing protein n=1 Tax=Athelia psychrophila TaxID=1759441 RepID=A0A166PUE2_9AGAM|nr:hypothetical protein FIBSPDRAFT_781950 [Fibularhizoctonia sp. CBS 109695]